MTASSLLLLPLLLTFTGSPLTRPPTLVETAASVEQPKEQRRGSVRILPAWLPFTDSVQQPAARQVRIEQRVIVRIVPQSARQRPSSVTQIRSSVPSRLVERPVEGCVALRAIAGASVASADRLRLYTRNRQILNMRLNKQCRADAFYSGFYVEKSDDGMLCPDRDVIQSRSGMRCTVGQLSQFVVEPIE